MDTPAGGGACAVLGQKRRGCVHACSQWKDPNERWRTKPRGRTAEPDEDARRAEEELIEALRRADGERRRAREAPAPEPKPATTTPKSAGVVILSTRATRLGAKYHRIALAIALQNEGACLAAATSAGAHEGIATRGNGTLAGDTWLEATGRDPRVEAPIGAFGFGHEA